MRDLKKEQQMIDEFNSKRNIDPEFMKNIEALFSKPIIVLNTRPTIPNPAKQRDSGKAGLPDADGTISIDQIVS